jgi:hypothetical protein
MITHYPVKISEIFEQSSKRVGTRLHLARQKLLFGLVFSVIETRSVQFTELSTKLNEAAKDSSNLRRIQSFFAHYALDYRVVACVLMSFVASKKCRLSIDRTNWQFGDQHINVLTLTVYCHGVGIPLLFELLDKKGNSNQQERIDLLGEFVALFGKERILSLTADREFIGHKWLKWLIEQGIDFAIRFPHSHLITRRDGVVHSGKEWLANHQERYFHAVILDGVRVNVALQDLGDDLLIVAGSFLPKKLFEQYRYRWSIETFFQSLKKRGFRLEETHLKDLDRLRNLMAIVALAFVFCWQVGLHHHIHTKKIPVKNHGYKANSFFRKGVDLIRNACKFLETRAERLQNYVCWLAQYAKINTA